MGLTPVAEARAEPSAGAHRDPLGRIVLVTLAVLGICLLVLAGLATAALAWDSWETARADRTLQRQTVYWRSVVDREIQVGEPQEQVEKWLPKRFSYEGADYSPTPDPHFHAFYIYAGTVDAGGFHFPCSSWEIMVRIYVGPDGRVSKTSVQDVGACI